LPFDLDRTGSASRTFCIALVTRLAGSLPRDVGASSAGTVNHAGRRPMNSAAFH
jgi:hypothetical protein